jgi:hypothetical protein
LGFRIASVDDWRDSANCRNLPVETFFTTPTSRDRESHSPAAPPGAARALRTCAGCTVRRECLTDQITWERHDERKAEGTFGGSTDRMRRDARLRGLTVEQRVEVLTEWFEQEIAPTILAKGERLVNSTGPR